MKLQFRKIQMCITLVLALLYVQPLTAMVKSDAISVENVNQYPRKQGFVLPDIPPLLINPTDRLNYLGKHYWDNFDFSDTSLINQPDITEQAFVDFVDLVARMDEKTAKQSIAIMLSASIKQDGSGKMYSYFKKLYRQYLYDPRSPIRNELMYGLVADYIIADSNSDSMTKEKAKYDLSVINMNKVGSVATDFAYTLASGKQSTLKKFTETGVPTLLYFYNPDCEMCKKTTSWLRTSPMIAQLLKNNRIRILAVYLDEDTKRWKEHQVELPKEWTVGYDKDQIIKMDHLYDIKSIPSLYLLDSNQVVVLKDVDYTVLEAYLKAM